MALIVVGAIVGGFSGLLLGVFIGYGAGILLQKSINCSLRIAQSVRIDSILRGHGCTLQG